MEAGEDLVAFVFWLLLVSDEGLNEALLLDWTMGKIGST